MVQRQSLGIDQQGQRAGAGWLGRLFRRARAAPSAGLPEALRPGSTLLESCRTLRVNLTAGGAGGAPPPLLLTSNGPDRRCALVAAGLAAVLAEEGRSTLLVDAGLRQPILHELFALPASPGLGEALEAATAAPAPVPVAERLAVLPAGAPAGDIARLYREPAIAALTRALAERFEAVVYLASTPWASADVLVLAPHVGAAVLAVRAGVDSADEMRRLKADLERAGVRLLGFTLVEQRR